MFLQKKKKKMCTELKISSNFLHSCEPDYVQQLVQDLKSIIGFKLPAPMKSRTKQHAVSQHE